MKYKIYTDKDQNFKCKLFLEGASLNDTKVRLTLTTQSDSLVFNGVIDKSGNCTVLIPALQKKLGESTGGLMTLEVIAENVYFKPYESSFRLLTSKKLEVNFSDLMKKEEKEIEDVTDVLYQMNESMQNLNQTIEELSNLKDKVDNINIEKIVEAEKKIKKEIIVDSPIKEDFDYDGVVENWGTGKNTKQINEDNNEFKIYKKKKKDSYDDITDSWGSNLTNDLED